MDIEQEGKLNQRLARAVAKSYRDLETVRKVNKTLVDEYVGPSYGNNPGPHVKEKFINLMKQAVSTYQMILAANSPKVMISTVHPELQGFAREYQAAINALLKEIGFEKTFARCVLDAYFSVGIVKIHLADSGLVELEPNFLMDPGRPFASNVNLDNFVFDTGAKSWEEIRFAGDMYRIPFEDLQSDIYDQEAVKDVRPSSKAGTSSDRLETISRGTETDDDELEPMVDLCDIWIRRLNVVRTYVVHDRGNMTLKEQHIAEFPWTGSDAGPYRLLGFDDVPENILPLAPAIDLEPLDRSINNLYRKEEQQARRAKNVNLYTPAGAAASERIRTARDGEWIQSQDPKNFNQVNIPGVDQPTHAFLVGSMQLFDRQAGNLTAMAGLGSQTPTVGQEKLVREAASRREQQMQYKVMSFLKDVVSELGKLLWQDAFKTIVSSLPLEGLDFSVVVTWKPGDREGNFADYNFDIDVYSMQMQTPGSKLEKINQVLTQVFLPVLPLIQQQGGQLNMPKICSLYSELLGIPELNDVVIFSGVPPQGSSPILDSVPKAPTSTRNYVRTNRSQNGDQPTFGLDSMAPPAQQTGAMS